MRISSKAACDAKSMLYGLDSPLHSQLELLQTQHRGGPNHQQARAHYFFDLERLFLNGKESIQNLGWQSPFWLSPFMAAVGDAMLQWAYAIRKLDHLDRAIKFLRNAATVVSDECIHFKTPAYPARACELGKALLIRDEAWGHPQDYEDL
jgi:hypothetical protein